MEVYRIGLDVGSTTAKVVVLDAGGEIVFSKYERHHADIQGVVNGFLKEILERLGNIRASVAITGSVGMGLAERFGVPFVQEVIAATRYVKEVEKGISTIIDIGGEDAKIVYLREDGNADLRMNGNCAGGTGAFIDQMAMLLNVPVEDMDALAAGAQHTHPIASRCGVFSKTDVQNLISKNVSKADIAASIFRAVAVQTIGSLSHGCEVKPGVLFCGGPLTFIPALRRAFIDYLELPEENFIVPAQGYLIPAWGAALSCDMANAVGLQEFMDMPEKPGALKGLQLAERLPAIFTSQEEYEQWKERKSRGHLGTAPVEGCDEVWLGIDSGSTTTKIVAVDREGRIVYSYYAPNSGNSIRAAKNGLEGLRSRFADKGVVVNVAGSCSTGYGEDLIKAALNLDNGIIETIAHYVAAREVDPDVSFILDIGGQDMKAIFVDHGVLSRMELNEACSSGCGSFIETFARSLNYEVADFAREACFADQPCDLGTRCTVFMNSKVKQVMREGASIGDIAAGLSYSVVKNCLYKVLKLKKSDDLGGNIVVQGGTMKNDSVVRAFEKLSGVEVGRSDHPELMGAYGCALYARSVSADKRVTLDSLLATAEYESRPVNCGGCENRCFVQKYTFANGNTYYSGNKCEKIFSNLGADHVKGRNLSTEKYGLIFDRPCGNREGAPRIGIPRVLNMYENYPFWHALLEGAGFNVVLSSASTYDKYEAGVHSVMSDNICFPAKLAHSHIYELDERGVDRIFFPYVVFEKPSGDDTSNSYNCPVVAGYSEVIKNAIEPSAPVDAPVITFRDHDMLERECRQYLASLGVDGSRFKKAFRAAVAAQEEYERAITEMNRTALAESRAAGRTTIMLAGRPYHTDPLVQHKLSDMIAAMGVDVVTEDIVRGDPAAITTEAHLVTQWTYINRILGAAQWAALQGDDVHFVQMTSFGCGPDAFLLDEVKNMLQRHGKSFTMLKIDDVNNIGSLKLRVRSVVESIRFGQTAETEVQPFVTTKIYEKEDRRRTLIAPFFTDYVSPLVPAAFKYMGYNLVQLPESDMETAEYGLRYANNEVCYPATLVVGDLIKALDSGVYDKDEVAVIITQTGGQCRATNYVALLKRAMVEAGYEDVPVLSLAMGGRVNSQPGFKVNWLKFLPIAIAAVVYGDVVSKFYHASAAREKNPGAARRLREKWLGEAEKKILTGDASGIYDMIPATANDFNTVLDDAYGELPRVGIVGEIYLKFNGFAHKRVVDWLLERRIEVVPPVLLDFFMIAFPNKEVRHRTGVKKSQIPLGLLRRVYGVIWNKLQKVNAMASAFRYYVPFHNVYEQADNGREVISLSSQFGEGWLLPAEVVTFAKHGVNNVISLQPFGCIANHIVSKGAEKKIKTLYPRMNLLSLDFDSGVSDVNVTNRLMLMAENIR